MTERNGIAIYTVEDIAAVHLQGEELDRFNEEYGQLGRVALPEEYQMYLDVLNTISRVRTGSEVATITRSRVSETEMRTQVTLGVLSEAALSYDRSMSRYLVPVAKAASSTIDHLGGHRTGGGKWTKAKPYVGPLLFGGPEFIASYGQLLVGNTVGDYGTVLFGSESIDDFLEGHTSPDAPVRARALRSVREAAGTATKGRSR